jgi:hypothetical protein
MVLRLTLEFSDNLNLAKTALPLFCSSSSFTTNTSLDATTTRIRSGGFFALVDSYTLLYRFYPGWRGGLAYSYSH